MAKDFFHSLFTGVENTAQQQQQQAQAQKDQDIQMYQSVLLDPNSDPDQRKRAADKITQLRGLDKKESPIGRLADFLNQVSHHVRGAQGANQNQQQPPAGNTPPSQGGATQGGSAQGKSLPPVSPLKEGFAQKALHGLERGLGGVLNAADYAVSGARPQSLPPIDSTVFPTAATEQQQKIDAMVKERQELIDRNWTPEEADLALGLKVPNPQRNYLRKGSTALASAIKQPNQILYDGSPLTDASGKLAPGVDPNAKYYPMVNTVDNAVRWYPESVRDQFIQVGNRRFNVDPYTGNYYDPSSGQVAGNVEDLINPGTSTTKPTMMLHNGNLVTIPITTTHAPNAPQSLTPLTGGQTQPSTPKTAGKSQGKKSASLPGKPSTLPSGAHNYGTGFVSPGSGMQLMNRDTPINVAGQGLENFATPQNFNILKNSEEAKKVGSWIQLNNRLIEQSGRSSDDPTTWSGFVKWDTGFIPEAIKSQVNQVQNQFAALTPQEQNLIISYYNLMGNWAGMRKATGSSAAQWSFNNLAQELPFSPGKSSYGAAVKSIELLKKEYDRAANPNMQVQPLNLPQLGGKSSAADEYLKSIGVQ